MGRTWYYTSHLDDTFFFSLQDEDIQQIPDKKCNFIPKGELVELYQRCCKLFGPLCVKNEFFQKVLKISATYLPLNEIIKVANTVKYVFIPKWKRSKRSLETHFHDTIHHFQRSHSLQQINNLMSTSYQQQRLNTLLEEVEDTSGNLKVFLNHCLNVRPEECIQAIKENEEFKETLSIALDFVIDGKMQASWRDDIGLSYRQLRLIRKELAKFPMASEREVVKEVHLQNQQALPVHDEKRELSDGTEIMYSISDLKEKIKLAATQLISRKLIIPQNATLRIKISGDGYLRTHKLGHVLFTFTFLDSELAHQSFATWDLCVLDGAESMDSVAIVMEEISNRMKDCTSIDILERTYNTEFFFTSDQKFLALVIGKTSANSKYFCNWCECTKENRGNLHDDAPLRSMENMVQVAARMPSTKTGIEKWKRGEGKGIGRVPCLSSISFDHIVPDIMHLFLRIVEKLLLCLFKYYEDDARSSEKYLEEVRKLLRNKNFRFKYKDGLLAKPNIDGKTMKNIIMNLPETLILTKHGEKSHLQKALKDLGCNLVVIYETLWMSRLLNKDEQEILKSQIAKFGELWILLFPRNSWNNSCHVLHRHVMHYVSLYGSIYHFSQEHVEGQIGRMKTFLKQTASKSLSNTKAVMEYDNRKLNVFNFKIRESTRNTRKGKKKKQKCN